MERFEGISKDIKHAITGVRIVPWRRAGNTIRIINNTIEILFEEGSVIVYDHHEYGEHKEANKHLLDSLKRRLVIEHRMEEKNLTFKVLNNKYVILVSINGFRGEVIKNIT